MENYKAEVSRILFMMASVFRDDVGPVMVEAWTAILQSEGVTIKEFQAAAVEVMKSRKYNRLPPPADILDVARPRVDTRAGAEQQADIVLREVRGYRRGCGLPEFSDPITDYLMKSRWSVATLESDLQAADVKWWRKDFVEAYQAATEGGKVKRLRRHEKDVTKKLDIAGRLSSPVSAQAPAPELAPRGGGRFGEGK